jgi:zinc transporter ZupT
MSSIMRSLLQDSHAGHDHGSDAHDDHGTSSQSAIDTRLAIYATVVVIECFIGSIVLPRVGRKFHRIMHYMNSFSGATLFATALFHLLPELREAHLTKYPWDMVIVAASFLGIMFLEKVVFHVHGHTIVDARPAIAQQALAAKAKQVDGDAEATVTDADAAAAATALWKNDLMRNMINVGAISLHSLIAGISLGHSRTMGGLDSIFIAIVSHKLFEGLAIGSRVMATSSSPYSIYPPLALFCLMTPIGAVIGNLSRSANDPYLDMVLDSLSAGTFLYIGVIDMVEEHEMAHHEEHSNCSVLVQPGQEAIENGGADEQAVAKVAAADGGGDDGELALDIKTGTAASELESAPLKAGETAADGGLKQAPHTVSVYGQYAACVGGITTIALATWANLDNHNH